MTQDTKPLTVRLPDELAEALRNYAFVADTSANEVVKAALAEYLKDHAHTDIVRAAFDKALHQHAVAFDKLAKYHEFVESC
jgi:predicted transcriptional regulator